MVVLSTFSGTANLLLTTWQIRNWGLRTAIVQQTFWPALRNLTQIYATFLGGRPGITILQSTQLITILGGGAGYMLSANSYIAEVVSPVERTAAFGVLAGVSMLGTAVGYTAGGLANDLINNSAPFEITFCLLVASTLYTALLLPYVAPAAETERGKLPPVDDSIETSASSPTTKTTMSSPLAFLACLRVFLPARFENKSGTFYGLTLLGVGAFGGVLAAYVPLMLQLTATNQYGYKPSDNGFLMSTNALSRALFLTLAFPRIIAAGRRWFARRTTGTRPITRVTVGYTATADSRAAVENGSSVSTPTSRSATPTSTTSEDGTLAPTTPVTLVDLQEAPVFIAKSAVPIEDTPFASVEDSANANALEEDTSSTEEPTTHGSGFDLAFLRWSMIVDAILTALVGFSGASWHMMAAAAILPLASGTAPACKGVLMDMVPEARRADALAGIALVETLALISTVSLFGALFAFLSDIGHPSLVFFCNAAVALLAAAVLFSVRFPRGMLRAA